MTINTQTEIIALGRIQRPKGLQGLVRVTKRGELLPSLSTPINVNTYYASSAKDGLLVNAKPAGSINIESIEEIHIDYMVVRVSGIKSSADIELLRGLWLGIELSLAKKRIANKEQSPWLFEYLHMDIIENKKKVGSVQRVEEYNRNIVLVIKSLEAKEILLPVNSNVITKIDRRENKIYTENIQWLDPDYAN